MNEHTSNNKKKFWILLLGLIAIVVLSGWTVFRLKDKHSIYLYFPTSVWLEEPDTLDVYVDGELIQTISTEGKLVEKIEYDSLEYEDLVTVYSHVLGETYECETIKEAIEHIEENIAAAGSWPLSRFERAEYCAHKSVSACIDYVEGEFDEHSTFSYNELLEGVCKVNIVLKNAEVITEDEAFFGIFYVYDDCATNLVISYMKNVESGQIKEVLPINTEYIFYSLSNEADRTLLKGRCEVNGRSSVDIVIDFAECLD